MKFYFVFLFTVLLSSVASAAIPNIVADSEENSLQLDITKIKQEISIEAIEPIKPKPLPIELKDIETIRLNNYEKAVKIDLLDYINTKEVKWRIKSEFFDTEISDNVLSISYNDDELLAFEDLELFVHSPDKKEFSTKFRVNYLNIEESVPPSSGFPEINLFQDKDYSEAEILLGEASSQTIELHEGWNFISFNLEPNNNLPEEIFSPILDKVLLVQSFIYNNYRGEWKNYIPGAPQELQSLKSISPAQGYWVLVTEDTSLIVQGLSVDEVEINLDNAWNMISFPNNINNLPAEAFSSILEQVDFVYGYEDGVWKSYIPERPEPLNSLKELKPGSAYWLNTNAKVKTSFSQGKYKFKELDNNNYEAKSYAYLNGRVIAQNNDGEINFYHNDYLGSVRAITNINGEIVWSQINYPFGNQLFGEGEGNSKKFLGKEQDFSTGLIYMDSRYLDPETGRFISADPLEGSVETPMSINKYSYAFNNPLRYVDPNGQSAWDYMSLMYEGEIIGTQIEMAELASALDFAYDVGMDNYVEAYEGTPVDYVPNYLRFHPDPIFGAPNFEVDGDLRFGVGIGTVTSVGGYGAYAAVTSSVVKPLSQAEISLSYAGISVSSQAGFEGERPRPFFRFTTSASEGPIGLSYTVGIDSTGSYGSASSKFRTNDGSFNIGDQSISYGNHVIIGPGEIVKCGACIVGDVSVDFTPGGKK